MLMAYFLGHQNNCKPPSILHHWNSEKNVQVYLSKIQSSIYLAYYYSIKKGGSLKPSLSALVVYQPICSETINPTISMAKVIPVLDHKSLEHEELVQTQI